jgi:alpha-glucosidase (family GH31 glycosyl hydrolase)
VHSADFNLVFNSKDPAINNTQGYYPYDSGMEKNVFVKYSDRDEPLVGQVWPGSTVFPDFTNPNASEWWSDLAKKFHDQIPFDGLWIVTTEFLVFWNHWVTSI